MSRALTPMLDRADEYPGRGSLKSDRVAAFESEALDRARRHDDARRHDSLSPVHRDGQVGQNGRRTSGGNIMSIVAAGGFQTGLALGMASMASVGPNNLMMIREGLLRGRVMFVASLVWGTYVALIAASYLLGGSIASVDPAFRAVLSWIGLVALAWFALQSFRAASVAGRIEDRSGRAETGRSCLARVMGVVWMNPLTYVELLLVPAALGQSFAAGGARLEFVMALILIAALCCYGYSLGGGMMASLLRSRASLRLFDLISGLILSAVALTMAAGLVAQ